MDLFEVIRMDKLIDKKNKIVGLLSDPNYVPMKEKELVIVMQVSPEDRPIFKKCLEELLRDGEITISKRGKYSIPVVSTMAGTFLASGHGYGFVTVEDIEGDFYIAEKNVNGAMHGDIVMIDPYEAKNIQSKKRGYSYSKDARATGKSKEAIVIDIVKRAVDTVVGTYDAAKNQYGFVIPDSKKIDQDIFIPKGSSMGAVDGSKVVAKIVDYGGGTKSPEGKIIEILGHEGDPGVDVLSILKAYGVETEFPEKVMNQAAKIQQELLESDYKGREDLRDLTLVTIDGADTKDIDDAVSLTMQGDNYILGVHIADVSHYVKEGSALDREALDRGTSVYPVDRVVPMFPHLLSNGICSLNEDVDRLALSCFMTVNKKGEIIDHRFSTSVIHSNHKMTYSDVDKIITHHDKDLIDKYSDVADMLMKMHELALILRMKRKNRGSIDFDIAESKIVLNEKGHPVDIFPYERNNATKLIEDFMLAANETVAEHFFWADSPFVYRIHEKPDSEKIKKLSLFIRNFGYGIKVKDDSVHPKELQKLLAGIEETKEEALITRLTLRAMQRAKYSVSCEGHFGLALKYYCHFTSPIRRYPDLQIHRIIKESLKGALSADRIEHYNKILPEVCLRSSTRERLADDIEREVEKLKKAEYMLDHMEEIYDGVISGVTNWGIYVELPNTVEGLVQISKIKGDYFVFNEEKYELIGRSKGKRYSLGDRVTVIVNDVDLTMRTIDFLLVE